MYKVADPGFTIRETLSLSVDKTKKAIWISFLYVTKVACYL